jgi:hypothetical protein
MRAKSASTATRCSQAIRLGLSDLSRSRLRRQARTPSVGAIECEYADCALGQGLRVRIWGAS